MCRNVNQREKKGIAFFRQAMVECEQLTAGTTQEEFMAEWELRPLSLGEILDRTFTLYRRNFLLFLGITAIPHLLTLGLNITQVMLTRFPTVRKPSVPVEEFQTRVASNGVMAFGIGGLLVAIVIYLLVYLFSQGGTIYAVSDLYLGRPATITGSLKKMWGQLLNLLGVTILNGLAVAGAAIVLIIPGIYAACRLLTCVPAALLEDLGARASLERSWELTKDNAGRAFLIYLLYFAMLYGIMAVSMIPFGVMMTMSAKDPTMLRTAMVLMQVASFVASIIVGPFLLIATSVFYYDLRVKKEAFDLQMMMNPEGIGAVPAPSVPSIIG